MGFGHRVYKSYDPRAKIIKRMADLVFEVTGKNPLLEMALELERIALEDEYFVSRRLYPNVDFYSGLIYQAMGFPLDDLPGAVRHSAHRRLDGPMGRDADRSRAEDRAAAADLHRLATPRLRVTRQAAVNRGSRFAVRRFAGSPRRSLGGGGFAVRGSIATMSS